VSPLLVQDFPYTAAYPHLLLATLLLRHPPTLRGFLAHPDFHGVMEGLLARKAPSPKDLAALLPHVWWRGCRDETASEERLRASVSCITTTLAKVRRRGGAAALSAGCVCPCVARGGLMQRDACIHTHTCKHARKHVHTYTHALCCVGCVTG
jgi:hypothetical protein